MQIPTEADWRHSPRDLDVECAYRNFHGKTLDEAAAMFTENSLRYQEDVMFMPVPCFYFYVHAYMNYLFSAGSRGDPDGASCFFGLVKIRQDEIRRGPAEVRTRIRQTLLRLRDNQVWYDAAPEIYGDFGAKADVCLKMIDA